MLPSSVRDVRQLVAVDILPWDQGSIMVGPGNVQRTIVLGRLPGVGRQVAIVGRGELQRHLASL